VGALDDGSDIAALLEGREQSEDERFVLMDFVTGVETGVGAYFDGERFLLPACIDWEHKRFFAGDMGELTGEMGTLATYAGSEKIFDATLAPMAPLLREAGHVGYVNLNTIINAGGIWPIEFTCRFGYPGFAVLEPLHGLGWGDLFHRMIMRDRLSFETKSGWSLCVVLTTPPFPYSRQEVEAPVGMPVLVGDIEREHLHLGEVGLANGQLVTSGLYGWTAVVTGTGSTAAAAKAEAYRRAALVEAPNLRYRLDIGDRQIDGALDRLASWGWLS
jgi:phosphoribosylamine--glycine ligase